MTMLMMFGMLFRIVSRVRFAPSGSANRQSITWRPIARRVAIAAISTVCLAPSPVLGAQTRRVVVTPRQTTPKTKAPTLPVAPTVDSSLIPPAIRAGTLVRPETVSVGDPFVFVVSVIVPTGARIEWPSITDTAAVVAMREPVRVTSETKGPARTETATYSLAPWDVGALPIGLPDAIVHVGDKALRVPMTAARVVVKTVLSGDTTLLVPKPAKTLFPRLLPWWKRWWPALAIIAALALLWWIWSRRKRGSAASSRSAPDAYARAVHDFERLERLALVDAGEGGRFVALAVEILRTYLSARVPNAALSRTTSELVVMMADDIRVPIATLLMLLEESDAIKFARRSVTPVRARALAADARAIVEQIELAERARIAAEQARLRDEERAQRDAAKASEDEARRQSRRPKSGAT